MNGYDIVTLILFLFPVIATICCAWYWVNTDKIKDDVYHNVNGILAGLTVGCWGALLLLMIVVKLDFWPIVQ